MSRAGKWYRTWEQVRGELQPFVDWTYWTNDNFDEAMVAWDRDCPDVLIRGFWVDGLNIMINSSAPDGRLVFHDWCTHHLQWESERCPRRGGTGNPAP